MSNSQLNKLIRAKTRVLDSQRWIKKENQISEEENLNYLSENSFSSPFKSRLRIKQSSFQEPEQADKKSQDPQVVNNDSFEESYTSVKFLEVDSIDMGDLPLIQCRESFGSSPEQLVKHPTARFVSEFDATCSDLPAAH